MRPHADDGDNEGDAGTPVPAREYRFSEVILTKGQFEWFVGKGAYNSFFNTGTKPPEPAFKTFKTLRITSEYKDGAAEIQFGLSNKKIKLEESVRFKNLSFKFEDTGIATLSCTMVAVFPHDLKTLELENFLGKEVDVLLDFGKVDKGEDKKQTKMAFDNPDDGEQEAVTEGADEEDDD